MAEPEVFICRVETQEGSKDYVTLVPPDVAFKQGLTPETIIGVLIRPLTPGEPITTENFARNRSFVEFLHKFLATEIPKQRRVQAEARRLGNGWILILDQRTKTPEGPVPPEDIIGAIEAKEGQLVPGSYRHSPNHRILSRDGFFRLDPDLHEGLLREIGAVGR